MPRRIIGRAKLKALASLHRDGLVRLSDPLVICSVPPLEPESGLPRQWYCLRERPPRQVIPVCVELEALKGDFRGFLFGLRQRARMMNVNETMAPERCRA